MLTSLPLLFTGKSFGIWFHLAATEAKKYKLNLLALCLLKGALFYYYMRM